MTLHTGKEVIIHCHCLFFNTQYFLCCRVIGSKW